VTQMDMLDLLAGDTSPRDRDAEVLAVYLPPWKLDSVVQALDDPGRLRSVWADFVASRSGFSSRDHWYDTTTQGIQVDRWPGEPAPWLIRWTQVRDVVRAHTTQAKAAALRAAVAAHLAHTLATPQAPWTPFVNRTVETDAAEARWRVQVGEPHWRRAVELDAAARAAAEAILPARPRAEAAA
jgi:hypothetical protein